jgi:hypothetical protein
MCWRDLRNNVSFTSSIAERRPTALEGDELGEGNSDGSVENSSKSKRDLLSRMSVLIEIEETDEMVEGVLVKMTGERSGDNTGVTTVVEDGTCNRGERTAGRRDGGDIETDEDTIAVGVRERDEEEEVIGGDSLEELSLIVLSR